MGVHRPSSRLVLLGLAACGGSFRAPPMSAQTGSVNAPAIFAAPASARQAGMNGAGAALVGDAGALFANPAGLATVSHIGLEGGYRSYLTGGHIVTGALAWRLRQFDLGVGIGYLDFGADPGSLPLPGATAGTAANERAGVGALVYRFGMIAFSGSGKYVRRTVGSVREEAVSADAGIAIAVFDIMALGFSRQNIGGNWRDQSSLVMPGLSRFGFTMNYVDPQETFRLMSTLEVQWPEGEGSRLVLGGEAGIVLEGVGIIGRAAYGSRPEGALQSRLTFGATIAMAQMSVDYAYRHADARGDKVHHVGLRIGL